VRERKQRGSVTAETAIVVPVLVVVLFAGLWVVGVLIAGVRCGDAARDVARAIARGESETTATAIGQRVAPPGAEIAVSRQGDDVVVSVNAAVRADRALLRLLPSVDVGSRATVQLEPDGEFGQGGEKSR
jgi:Flp pilus assembly protein TadG